MNKTPREVMNEKASVWDLLAFLFIITGICFIFVAMLYGAYLIGLN